MNQWIHKGLTACLLIGLAAGCAGELKATNNGDGSSLNANPGNISLTDEFICRAGTAGLGSNSDGSFSMCVDATDFNNWIYFDLETRTLVQPSDPLDSPVWDIGFFRFNIKENGGVSGSGGVEVSFVQNQGFGNIDQAPSGDYFTDESGDANGDGFVDYVFNTKPNAENDPTSGLIDVGWFQYDAATHVLMPRTVVYVIKTVEGAYYKLEVLDYYDAVGTSGFMSVRFAPVTNPN